MGNSTTKQDIPKMLCDFTPPSIDPTIVTKVNFDMDTLLCHAKTTTGSESVSYMIARTSSTVKKWIIFSHNNKSTIFNHYFYAKKLCNELNVGCVFYDYPGYGFSTGYPTPASCVCTLKFVIEHFTKTTGVARKDIVLMGHALGANVVISYAYQYKWPYPTILVSPYRNICRKSNNNFKLISNIDLMICPAKFIHGKNDTIIPMTEVKNLAKLCIDNTFKNAWVTDANHYDILVKIPAADLLEVIDYSVKQYR